MFKQRMPLSKRTRGKRLSPLMLVGVSVPVLVALIAGTVFVVQRMATHAANPNMDCTLIVPANPLSAQGLATPYQLVATNAANGPCNEANVNQSAFINGAIIDPATGQISVYNPVIVDQGTQPAVAPTVPQLPANAVVALWFGFNGNNLTLQDTNGSLAQGNCVNGAPGSIFTQVAYCNAPLFFAVANFEIRLGRLHPPALGMAKDGKTCESVRDFALIDQDQSDNVPTGYLATANGQIAQDTVANTAALANATVLRNGSDNFLLDGFVDPALGCTPWMAPDLANNGAMAPALPLNELQAAAGQQAPIALVPLGDPMTLLNGQNSVLKTDLYRLGVDQGLIPSFGGFRANAQAANANMANQGANANQATMLASQAQAQAQQIVQGGATANQTTANATQQNTFNRKNGFNRGGSGGFGGFLFGDDGNTTTYCKNILNTAPARLTLDQTIFVNNPTPAAATGNNLFTFLAARLNATWTNLNCQQLTGIANPVTLQLDGNMVAIGATFNTNGTTTGTGTTTPTVTTTTTPGTGTTTGQVNCTVNGTTVAGCTGTAMIGNSNCNLSLNTAASTVNINCRRSFFGGQGQQQGASNGQPNCVINNRTVIQGCNGTATINRQSCTLALDTATNTVNITCGANQQQQ